MMKIIPMLSDPERHGRDPRDAFHVVAPSIPGFGFSGKPGRPGMTPQAITDLWAKLMAGLGYDRFAVQGGDFGSRIERKPLSPSEQEQARSAAAGPLR
jgi:pimeloyl-ACP methyl ester carboxylesterase